MSKSQLLEMIRVKYLFYIWLVQIPKTFLPFQNGKFFWNLGFSQDEKTLSCPALLSNSVALLKNPSIRVTRWAVGYWVLLRIWLSFGAELFSKSRPNCGCWKSGPMWIFNGIIHDCISQKHYQYWITLMKRVFAFLV